jgi:hypothetical protein
VNKIFGNASKKVNDTRAGSSATGLDPDKDKDFP